MKDYYAILGIPSSATQDQIKAAYRASVKKYHPDVNPGHEQKARDAIESYKILSNLTARSQYDALRRNGVYTQEPQSGCMPAKNTKNWQETVATARQDAAREYENLYKTATEATGSAITGALGSLLFGGLVYFAIITLGSGC